MADAQIERAFQKQEGVFLASKKLQAKKTSSGVRFYKKIGLGKFNGDVSRQEPWHPKLARRRVRAFSQILLGQLD